MAGMKQEAAERDWHLSSTVEERRGETLRMRQRASACKKELSTIHPVSDNLANEEQMLKCSLEGEAAKQEEQNRIFVLSHPEPPLEESEFMKKFACKEGLWRQRDGAGILSPNNIA